MIRKTQTIFIAIILILSLQIGGCKKSVDESFFTAISSVSDDNFKEGKNVYLLIPNSGCSGCIHTAQQFLYDNIDSFENLKFIIHRFETKKELKIEFGNEIYNHENFIIDYKHIFLKNGFNSIYPTAFIVSNNKLIEMIIIKPEDGLKTYYQLPLQLKDDKRTEFISKYQLIETKEIEFNIDESGEMTAPTIQIFNKKNTRYFTYIIENYIYFYKYDSKKIIKKIFIDNEKYGFIDSYKIKSEDSIYIYSYFKQQLFLLNKNAKKINSWSLKNYCSKNSVYPSGTTNTPIEIIGDDVYMTSIPSKNNEFNLGLFCNINNNKISEHFNTKTYKFYKKHLISQYYEIYSTVNRSSNKFIYSFPLENNIYVYDKTKKESEKYYAGSRKIKTINKYFKDWKNDNKSLDFYSKTPNYHSILFDKFRNCYYRFAYLPIDTTKSYTKEELITKKPLVVIILDEKFQKIGETLLNKENYLPHISFITKEGLNIIKYEKSRKKNKMIFGVLELKETNKKSL